MTLELHLYRRWQIRRLFSRGLSPEEHRALQRHLSGCARCAASFEHHALGEAILCGGAVPSPLAVERVGAAVFGALPASPRPEARRGFSASPAFAFAAAALVLFTTFALIGPWRTPVLLAAGPDGTGLTARSDDSPRSSSPEVGIRLLRVTEDGLSVDEGRPVRLGELVTFTYSNTAGGMRHLALLGLQEDGEVRWFYPGAEGKSVPAEEGVIDEPLGDGFRLPPSMAPGWLRVTCLFSQVPVDRARVEEAVRELAGDRERLRSERLPLDPETILESTILVEVAP